MTGNSNGTVYRACMMRSNGGGSNEITDFVVMNVNVSPRARTTRHPLENGMSRIDSKIIEPRKITVTGYLPTDKGSTSDMLNAMWRNRKAEFYSVVDKDGNLYKNLIVMGIPHHGDHDMYDMLSYTVEFEEVLLSFSGKAATQEDPGLQTRVRVGTIAGS